MNVKPATPPRRPPTISRLLAIAFGIFLILLPNARAAVTFTFDVQEVGANLEITGSGTLDITGLAYYGPNTESVAIYFPNQSFFIGGGSSPVSIFYGPSMLNPYPLYSPLYTSDYCCAYNYSYYTGSGDLVGIDADDGWVVVPQGYVSGSPLSDSATFFDATYASIGLSPGVYTFSWGSGANADSLEFDVGGSAVPEPAGLSLLSFAFVILGAIRCLRNSNG